MNDNRTSGGTLEECDVFVCSHCQKVINVQKWQKDGAFCHCCDKPICKSCGAVALQIGCVPFKKMVDRHLEEQYHRRQNAKLLGV